MEIVLNVCRIAAYAAIIVLVGYTIVTEIENKKKASFEKRKSQIEIGKSVNDRFANVERSLHRIECKLGELSSNIRLSYNKDSEIYNNNLEKISQDIEAINGLLNKQPEKKEDNSAILGIISGAISGILTGILANLGMKDSDQKESKSNEPITMEKRYGIQKKATGEILEQRFEGYYEAYKWLIDNNLNTDDYEIGIVNKKEEGQEENPDQSE